MTPDGSQGRGCAYPEAAAPIREEGAPVREKIDHGQLRQLYDYWDRKRGTRVMPSRADLDPVDIPALLPNLILVDVERGEQIRFRFRLYGTDVCAIRGVDLTGRYIDEENITALRNPAIASYNRILADRQPVYERHRFHPNDRNVGYYHRLVLPLGEENEVQMLLIGFYREIAPPEYHSTSLD